MRPTTKTSFVSQKPARRKRGFERTSGLLKDRIRKAGETRGFAVTRLLTHWVEIVGEDIAAATRPVKVGYGRGGVGATLTLLTTGAQAPMLQASLPKIKDQVNACYGYAAIEKIRLTQTAPTGFAEGQAQFVPAPKKPPKQVSPAVKAQAEETAAPIADDDLRKALSQLAQNVLSKSRNENEASK